MDCCIVKRCICLAGCDACMLVMPGRSGRIPKFMKQFLESYEHTLLVHAFSKDSNLASYDIPFIGLVDYSTVTFFLSVVASLYGLIYTATGARKGVDCSSFL
jgi:hypothetical protein